MLYLLLFLSASTFITLLTYLFLSSVFKRRLQIEKRINVLVEATEQREAIKKQKERDKNVLLDQLTKRWKAFVQKNMPKEKQAELEKKLVSAGRPFNMRPVNFMTLQVMLGAGLFIVLMTNISSSENPLQVLFFAVLLGIAGIYLPHYYLQVKTTQRNAAIEKMMPDFFDMLNLSVEAGLGLDAALKKVATQVKGPLSDEFIQLLDEMKFGKSKRQAFLDLRDRVPIESFQALINAIIQADQMGISMTKVLRAQTARIRESMRQKSKEKAMKAPVKMLVPMVLFIFPTLFIVLLGPIIIQLMTDIL
ncbi:type II secretion system F family protein [Texcoconibacillus texcoconensis]|uniref:Tight adherence protein C n=1 Tax=Texcoconibacillus texcoconensis TaxID=1095777 RepID=A0A840QQ29_9BACI|nr:type II secretion system F family protein [Texcoconibacillus texcoconensis]MBB5173484.1 tight adherence protein C [Texcoconibacillus texcoconensis]